MPLVSIVVPMRNAETYIGDCLRSLLQDSCALEVIVIDDRSSDRSRAIVASQTDRRIRIVDGPGTGIASCLNEGLKHATGSIIMRCDADDIYPKMRIKMQTGWLLDHPEFDAVCGSFSTIDEKGRLIMDMACGRDFADITDELRTGSVRTSLCTFAIRSNLLKKVGGFRPYFTTAEDIDFQLRLGEAGRIAYLPLSWYQYRIHPTSITHTQMLVDSLNLEDIARSFQKQRLAGRPDDLDSGNAPLLPAVERCAPTSRRHTQALLMASAWVECANGSVFKSIITGARAVATAPFSRGIWKGFFVLVVRSMFSY